MGGDQKRRESGVGRRCVVPLYNIVQSALNLSRKRPETSMHAL